MQDKKMTIIITERSEPKEYEGKYLMEIDFGDMIMDDEFRKKVGYKASEIMAVISGELVVELPTEKFHGLS